MPVALTFVLWVGFYLFVLPRGPRDDREVADGPAETRLPPVAWLRQTVEACGKAPIATAVFQRRARRKAPGATVFGPRRHFFFGSERNFFLPPQSV